MKISELIKVLKAGGCYPLREGTRHEKWFSPVTGHTFTVPRHGAKDVKPGLLHGILKEAGLKLK